jgi:capsular exopolysaccharide synthesis family protein
MSEEEIYNNSLPRKQIQVSPRELVLKYLRFIPWVAISVLFMLVLAFLKLRYSTPIYKVSGKILVKKNSNPYSNSNEKFDDIFMMQGNNNNLNDEIEIIKSRLMATRVVKSLELNKQYLNKGKIRTTTIRTQDMPFTFELQNIKDSSQGFSDVVTTSGEQQFRLNESPTLYSFGQWIDMPNGSFRLVRTSQSFKGFNSNVFIVSQASIEDMAAGLSSSILVTQGGEYNSNVVLIGYETDNTKLGESIVNQFMKEYQMAGLEDKKQIAVNTLAFIDTQLMAAKQDLGNVEKNLQSFQESNRIFSPEQQSKLFIDELTESNKQGLELGLKLKVTEYLRKYISDKKNTNPIVASALGIEEPSLIGQIAEFNKLQIERERAIKGTPVGNPLIQSMDLTIERLRSDMLENLSHVAATYNMAISEIGKKGSEANLQIQKLPLRQKQLLEKTREQKILEELYSYLLQKKLETSIASVSTISNIKVLEHARASSIPVSPNRQGVYSFFLLIGLAIPVAIVFLRELLNDKVKSKTDIEKVTNTPVLGEVGHAEEAGALVVKQNNRQYIAEQFRIIRSNIKYIIPKVDKPVMMVTSSFSGEGKSFISTNLGAVLAISGKKTVILEFDIRKPKIMEGLGLKERKGITNFIVGNLDINEIVYPVPGQENLFVIPCGPLPPNPAEMLLDEKVALLFEKLKKQFDVIIVDTAPVGLVSDAITLGQHISASVYIVRHNYTLKKQLQLVDSLYTQSKLPHMCIVINDVNASGGGYYGYGYDNYGYGYGYGIGPKTNHSGGYFEKETRKRSWWPFKK